MNVHDLIRDLEQDGRSEAHRIRTETLRQIEHIREETARMAKEKEDRLRIAAERELEQETERSLARRDRESGLALLSCKQELLESAFAQAREELAKLKGEPRKSLLAGLLKRAETEVHIEKIVPARQDRGYFKKKEGKSIESIGGFVAHGRDGVSLDCTFERLLEQVRTQHTQEIAGILFGEEES